MNQISIIIIKKLQGDISSDELEVLDRFAAESEENERLVARLTNYQTLLNDVKDSYTWYRKDDLRRIKRRSIGKVLRMRSIWIAVVAFILIVTVLLWRFFPENQGGSNILNIPLKYYNATLRMSKGIVPLSYLKTDSAYRALLQERSLIKTDQQLAYPVHRTNLNPGIDTLETHNESLYSLLLPDSSTVWLNCASNLRYPNSFSGTERVVQLDGEAYFEIVKDARPFKVLAQGMEIQVSGTKFNVRAYKKDGVICTTLLEGSVKIRAQNKIDSLNVGEQAFLNHSGQLKKKKTGSRKKTALAWKRNQFDWDHEPLETIIADICNWYGLTPVYQVRSYPMPLSATLNRSKPVNEVLAILEASAPIKFKQEGNNLLIGRP